MWLVKFIFKILILPILLVVGVARFLVSLAIRVYGFVSFWFWVLLAIITIMTIAYQRWDQTVIMLVLGAVSFVILFGAVWVQVTLEDFSEMLKGQLVK